jgi:hypothetical protein
MLDDRETAFLARDGDEIAEGGHPWPAVVPGVNIGLDQEPRGRRQQDQPAGYAGQLALQATDPLRQAAAGGLSPPLESPAPGGALA